LKVTRAKFSEIKEKATFEAWEGLPTTSCTRAHPKTILCKGQVHDAQGIAGIRAACKLAARVLDFAGTLVKVNLFICR
jgi:hypothetical protein